MTELLGKLFVKDHDKIHQKSVRRGWGTMVSMVGLILNLLLFAGKFTVGILFGAISISADAINNLSDAGSQLISLVSFRLSAKPADREHPFGHARIEYIASMIVSFLILIIGFDLLRDAGNKILHPGEATKFSWLSVSVLAVSIFAKLWLALLNKRVGKKIGSTVMQATAADSLSDAAATSAVLVSQFILKFTGFDPDAWLGVIVSLLIMWAGIGILRSTMNSLLGEAPDPEKVKEVVDLILSHPGALGVHDLMAHNYGPGCMIVSIHVEVDGSVNIFDSHDLIDNIEKKIKDTLGIITTIHLDPIVTNDDEVNVIRAVVLEKMKEIDPSLQIHDFRFVRGNTHTNLIFDIEAPFELKLTDHQLITLADKKMRDVNSDYRTVITVDRG